MRKRFGLIPGFAAPIRDASGVVVGAIDISTAAAGHPDLLLRAIAVATAIEQELAGSLEGGKAG